MSLIETFEQLFIFFQQPEKIDVNEVNDQISSLISDVQSIEPLIFLLQNQNIIISKTASFVLKHAIIKNKNEITSELADKYINDIMQIYVNLSEDFLGFVSMSIDELTFLTESSETIEILFNSAAALAQDDNKILHALYLCSIPKVLQMNEHYEEIMGIVDICLQKNNISYYNLCFQIGLMLFLIYYPKQNEEQINQLTEYFSNSFHQKFEAYLTDFNEDSFFILRECVHRCFSSNFNILPFNDNFPLLQQIILSPNSSHNIKYQTIDLIDDIINFTSPQLDQESIVAVINFKLDVSSSFFQLDSPEEAKDFDCGSNMYQTLFSMMEQSVFDSFISEKLELCLTSDDINIIAPLIDLLFHVPEWQFKTFQEHFPQLIVMCVNCILEGNNSTLTDISSAFLNTLIDFYRKEVKEVIDIKQILDSIFQNFLETQNISLSNVILCLLICFDSSDDFFEEYFTTINEFYHSDQLLPATPYILPVFIYYLLKTSQTSKYEFFDQILSLACELISSDSGDSFISSGINIISSLVIYTTDQMKEHIPDIVTIIQDSVSSDDVTVLTEGHNLLQFFIAHMREESLPFMQDFFSLILPIVQQYCEEDLTTKIGSKKLGFSLNSLFSILNNLQELFVNDNEERSQLIESLFLIINKAIESDGSYTQGADFLVSMFQIFNKNQIDLRAEYFSILNKLIERINELSDDDKCHSFVSLCYYIYRIFIICSDLIDSDFCTNLLNIIFVFINSNIRDFIDEDYISRISQLIRISIIKISNRFDVLASKMNIVQGFLSSSNNILSSIALSFLYPFSSNNNTPLELISIGVQISIKHLMHFPSAFHENAAYFLTYLPNRDNLPPELCESLTSLLPLLEHPSSYSDSIFSCICLLFNRYECLSIEQLIFLLENLKIQSDTTLIRIVCLFYIKISSIINDDLISPFISSFITLFSQLNAEEITKTTDISLLFHTFLAFSNIISQNPELFKSIMGSKTTEVQKGFTAVNSQLQSFFSAIIEEEDE